MMLEYDQIDRAQVPGGVELQLLRSGDDFAIVFGQNELMSSDMFASEEALAIVARESGIEPSRISTAVRQGGIYHEILEEAAAVKADLIVMTSHRPAMRTYFLGSNAGHVVRYAKCSVLVVRH